VWQARPVVAEMARIDSHRIQSIHLLAHQVLGQPNKERQFLLMQITQLTADDVIVTLSEKNLNFFAEWALKNCLAPEGYATALPTLHRHLGNGKYLTVIVEPDDVHYFDREAGMPEIPIDYAYVTVVEQNAPSVDEIATWKAKAEAYDNVTVVMIGADDYRVRLVPEIEDTK
jgi:hypothetical protein